MAVGWLRSARIGVGRWLREAVVISYDYTVLAGTRSMRNQAQADRLLELARRKRIPLVLFAEGGGGRHGATDALGAAGRALDSFRAIAGLRGYVPTEAIAASVTSAIGEGKNRCQRRTLRRYPARVTKRSARTSGR